MHHVLPLVAVVVALIHLRPPTDRFDRVGRDRRRFDYARVRRDAPPGSRTGRGVGVVGRRARRGLSDPARRERAGDAVALAVRAGHQDDPPGERGCAPTNGDRVDAIARSRAGAISRRRLPGAPASGGPGAARGRVTAG